MFGFVWNEETHHYGFFLPWWLTLPHLILLLGLLPFWILVAVFMLLGYVVGRAVLHYEET